MAFIPYNANPLYKDTDDCTVRAISLFTGKTYDETFVGIAVTGFELKQVLNQLNQMGLTPEQAVRQMLQSGGLSQQQFQQYAAQADQIFGKRR